LIGPAVFENNLRARLYCMEKKILGISAFYHDSAAALVAGGRVVAAAQEERFTRIKHDFNFPKHAIDYCLKEAGLKPEDLDYVVFYDKPLLKFDRLLETYLAYAPAGLRSFMMAMPLWLKTKLHLPREIRKALGGRYNKRIIFTVHHESHAASAFYPSPFEEAAILTMDGVGEWDTASIGHGKGNQIRLLKTLEFPHSLGLLYSAFTYFTGFKVNSGEYKLMGLAPYGEPKYVDVILDKLVDLKEDGSLAMNMEYFNYCQGLTMTNHRFDELFGGPPRKPESPIRQREMDLAASIQKVTEEAVLRMARTARKITGCRYLCLAGGVALTTASCCVPVSLMTFTSCPRPAMQAAHLAQLFLSIINCLKNRAMLMAATRLKAHCLARLSVMRKSGATLTVRTSNTISWPMNRPCCAKWWTP